MLTLVAAVLAYDMAREMWEVRSSAVETDGAMPGGRLPLASRNVRSWTRLEKDMLGYAIESGERSQIGYWTAFNRT